MPGKLDIRAKIAHLGLEYGSKEYKQAYSREYGRLIRGRKREYMRKWREKKRAAIREYKREYDNGWRAENREKLRENHRARRRQHPLFGLWAQVRRRNKSIAEIEALIGRLSGLIDERDPAGQ